MDLQQLLDALNEQTRKVNALRVENERLREVETELRTVLAHAYSEMSLDGVAQNISSAMFAEMRRMLGRRKAED